MRKVFNFNAGPAMLPEEVLLQAKEELLDWNGSGMSIMEIGHRTKEFGQLAETAESNLRTLMNIPKHYHVLFLSGGATTQFAMVPLNLLGNHMQAGYFDTGIWSKKAIAEAERYAKKINIVAKVEKEKEVAFIPPEEKWQWQKAVDFIHYTPNETVDGIRFESVPDTGSIPLAADMTSMILSEPIEVNRFGVIYAGAQKNIGPAGLNIAIVREDLAKNPLPFTPTLYQYKTHVENRSLYNTPPVFCWYMASLVFAWMLKLGGVPYFYELNQKKANTLYSVIDQYPDFYQSRVAKANRSLMNVMFYLPDERLTTLFLEESITAGMVNLRGHRVSGGIRASIYNAMPYEGISKLEDFMQYFVKRYG